MLCCSGQGAHWAQRTSRLPQAGYLHLHSWARTPTLMCRLMCAHACRPTHTCTHARSHTRASMFMHTRTRAGPQVPTLGPSSGERAGPGHPACPEPPSRWAVPAWAGRARLPMRCQLAPGSQGSRCRQPGDPPFTPLMHRPHPRWAGDLASSPDTTCSQRPH